MKLKNFLAMMAIALCAVACSDDDNKKEDTVIPALGHHWINVAEKGHWDTKLVWESRYRCRKCGFNSTDIDEIMNHCMDVCDSTYENVRIQVEKKTWIVDVPAHKECDRCHVTQ